MKLLICFILLLIGAPLAGAQNKSSVLQSPKNSLKKFGKASHKVLPSDELHVLVWNIYKGERPTWGIDYRDLSEQADLVLLQEGLNNHHMRYITSGQNGMEAYFAVSFKWFGAETGVVTLSHTKSFGHIPLRSPGREPLLNTPKMTLVNKFDLDNGQTLLVANIHGLNFTKDIQFIRQVQEVVDELRNHAGPILFAGDFNAHTKARLRYLREACQKLNLREIKFKQDPRIPLGKRILDFVFYRGFDLVQEKIHANIKGSDHFPMTVVLSAKQASK